MVACRLSHDASRSACQRVVDPRSRHTLRYSSHTHARRRRRPMPTHSTVKAQRTPTSVSIIHHPYAARNKLHYGFTPRVPHSAVGTRRGGHIHQATLTRTISHPQYRIARSQFEGPGPRRPVRPQFLGRRAIAARLAATHASRDHVCGAHISKRRRRWSSWRRSAWHCREPDPRPRHRRDGEHGEQHGQGARPDG